MSRCVRVCLYVCSCVYMCVCVSMRVCLRLPACIFACASLHVDACLHAPPRAYIMPTCMIYARDIYARDIYVSMPACACDVYLPACISHAHARGHDICTRTREADEVCCLLFGVWTLGSLGSRVWGLGGAPQWTLGSRVWGLGV